MNHTTVLSPENIKYSSSVIVKHYVISYNKEIYINDERINKEELVNILLNDLFMQQGKIVTLKTPFIFQQILINDSKDTSSVIDYMEYSKELKNFVN
jgi:uncharacterized membrane protein YwzB